MTTLWAGPATRVPLYGKGRPAEQLMVISIVTISLATPALTLQRKSSHGGQWILATHMLWMLSWSRTGEIAVVRTQGHLRKIKSCWISNFPREISGRSIWILILAERLMGIRILVGKGHFSDHISDLEAKVFNEAICAQIDGKFGE